MGASGGHNLGTLGRDDDTVGVDEEVVLEDVGDGHGGQLQMCPLGGNHISRFSRDHGTVGVLNKAVVDIGSHRLNSPCSRLDNLSSSMDSNTAGMVDLGSGRVALHEVVPACELSTGDRHTGRKNLRQRLLWLKIEMLKIVFFWEGTLTRSFILCVECAGVQT